MLTRFPLDSTKTATSDLSLNLISILRLTIKKIYVENKVTSLILPLNIKIHHAYKNSLI